MLMVLLIGVSQVAGDGGACTVDRGVRAFVGARATSRAIERARRASGARAVRAYRAGTPITQDLRDDRLNIETNRRGRITAVRCF